MADVLMEHLPPSGWTDVLRQRDLDQFREWVEHRFAVVDARFDATDARFDAKLEAELSALRDGLRRELHSEVGSLRRELHSEVGSLRDALHQEVGGLRQELNNQTRSLFIGISGLMLSICIVVFTAARLL